MEIPLSERMMMGPIICICKMSYKWSNIGKIVHLSMTQKDTPLQSLF